LLDALAACERARSLNCAPEDATQSSSDARVRLSPPIGARRRVLPAALVFLAVALLGFLLRATLSAPELGAVSRLARSADALPRGAHQPERALASPAPAAALDQAVVLTRSPQLEQVRSTPAPAAPASRRVARTVLPAAAALPTNADVPRSAAPASALAFDRENPY
jgi:hypothetical protein